MKVAVSAKEPALDSPVDSRFGRCPYYVIVETEDMSFESRENPGAGEGSGAGIRAGKLMSDLSVEYVLTGNCGPNAYRTLTAAGIRVIVGCEGTVAEVAGRLASGELTDAEGPNVDSHFGME